MTILIMEPRKPNPNPQTKEEKFDNLFLYQEEMIRQELERGNDLCEIIYSIMDNAGPSKLTPAQYERVMLIKKNTER